MRYSKNTIFSIFLIIFFNQLTLFACNPPSQIGVDNISINSVDISWQVNNIPEENVWEVEIFPAINGSNYFNVNSIPYTIHGLTSGTTYKVRVKSFCTQWSNWSVAQFSFSTHIENPSNCGLQLPIYDNNCQDPNIYNIWVNETGELGVDFDLKSINIIIDHPWEQDLSISLISPSNQEILLTADNGGANVDGYGDVNDCSMFTSFTMDSCSATHQIQDPELVDFTGSFFPQESFSLLDGSQVEGYWKIKICDDAMNHQGTLEFIGLDFIPVTCEVPKNVFALDMGGGNATIQWDGSDNVELILYEEGSLPSTGISYTPNSNPYYINDLENNLIYNVQLKTRCSNGDLSEASCLTKIYTDCSGNSPTLEANFDDLSICADYCGAPCVLDGIWRNEPSSFNWLVHSGQTNSPHTGPKSDISGVGNYIYLETTGSACNNGAEAILTSVCLDIIANQVDCGMAFFYQMNGITVNSLKLEISEDLENWITLWEENGNQAKYWKRQFIDLSTFNGKTVQLRFVGKGGQNQNGDIALDQIQFFGSISKGYAPFTYYLDQDGDGFGDDGFFIKSCNTTIPTSYSEFGGDCNDQNASINPNADEIYCNDIDENCNGMEDDSAFPVPSFEKDSIFICKGEDASFSVTDDIYGTINWFENSLGTVLISAGNTITISDVEQSKTIYAKQENEVGLGLKITEVEIDYFNSGVEIQNFAAAKDYSGWRVVVSDDQFDINNYKNIFWTLGSIDEMGIQSRSKNDWGVNFAWLHNFKGWVILLDDQNTIQDAVFWNWSLADLQNINFSIDGKPFNYTNIGWLGAAFDEGGCNSGESINRFGNSDHDSNQDFICYQSSLGNQIDGLNLVNFCESELKPLYIIVSDLEVEEEIIPNFCTPGASVNLTVSGGLTPYEIIWSDGTNEFFNQNLSPDIYSVSIMDEIGCEKVISNIDLTTFDKEISVNVERIASNLCAKGSDGQIVANIEDGIPPYQYNWSVGEEHISNFALDTLKNLHAGLFRVTITDGNGCVISSDLANVIDPPELHISIDSVEHEVCYGDDNGAIYISISGGVGAKTIIWNNGATGEDLVAGPGMYQVEVRDANQCVQTKSDIEIIGASKKLKVFVHKSDIICHNAANGQIQLQIEGGYLPYDLKWSNGSNQQNINNLQSGYYGVTLVDDGGCTQQIDSIDINEPATDLVVDYQKYSATCKGASDGVLEFNIQGGAPPYQIQWVNNVSDSNIIYSLSSGFYDVKVKDSIGCQKFFPNIFIEDGISELSYEVDSIHHVECFDTPIGYISILAENAIGEASYLWSSGSMDNYASYLSGDDYFCEISDESGCKITTSNFTILEPEALSIDSMVVINATANLNNGEAMVFPSGGTPPYSYNWNDENNQSTQRATHLEKGNYNVTIYDFYGCEMEDSVEVPSSTATHYVAQDIRVFPNPIKNYFFFEALDLASIQKIYITDIVGHEIDLSNKMDIHRGFVDISFVMPGIYFLSVKLKDRTILKAKLVKV